METKVTEKPKKASKVDSGEKEKKKKKSKDVGNAEELVKNALAGEEKKSKKRKVEVNKDDKPEKQKKSKDTSATNSATPSNPPVIEEKPKKRKRDSKEDGSSETKKKSKKEKEPTIPEELEIDVTAPNPPSKKALRLQKKGKPVPKLPSTSLPPTDPSTAAAAEVDITHPDRQKLVKEIPRAEWSVWIGNLSYKSDVKGLRGWLVRGDKRVTDKDITRINLPLNADGQSKGFAYVDFLTQEAMERVISRSEENFDGRNLLIKNGKSFEGRPAERKQRYQVKSAPSQGGRMQIDSEDANDKKEATKEEPVMAEASEKKERKEKRAGDEKIKKPKKAKQDV